MPETVATIARPDGSIFTLDSTQRRTERMRTGERLVRLEPLRPSPEALPVRERRCRRTAARFDLAVRKREATSGVAIYHVVQPCTGGLVAESLSLVELEEFLNAE